MDVFRRIADARINDAIERGEFDDLAGAGRPLEFEDLSRVPPDMRLAYRVLKNAEVLPPEVELRREMYSLGRLIGETADPEQREELRRRLRSHELHYAILIERRAQRRRRP